MHPLQIQNANIRKALYSMQVPAVRYFAWINGRMKIAQSFTPGGAPVWSPGYISTSWEISRWLTAESFTVNQTKPIMPGDGIFSLFDSSEISIKCINPAGSPFLATTQDGAIIDLQSIESAEIYCEIGFDGISDRMPFFMGKIAGIPTETEHYTEFRAYDIAFDALKTPVLFENFAQIAGQRGQAHMVYRDRILSTSINIPGAVGSFDAFGGLATFAERGDIQVDFSNNNPEQIDLQSLTVKNGAKPGKYLIEFTGLQNFKITFPDNSQLYGGLNSDFDSDFIRIPLESWTGTDGTGVTIEFSVQAAAWQGNPVAMIRNLIEKAYLRNWGEMPGINPLTGLLPVDWASFDELERQFDYFRVWVNRTNAGNDVWELKPGKRPLSCIHLAQEIADHCLASILIDEQGRIRIQGPRMYDDFVPETTTTEAILPGYSLAGPGGKKYNQVEIKYGWNSRADNYGVNTLIDLRNSPNDEPVKFTITAPFFKAGYSDNVARYIAEMIREKWLDRPVFLECEMVSGFVIPALPGDRVKVELRRQPVTSGVFEVVEIPAKQPGKSGRIELAQIQDQEGPEFVMGAGLVEITGVS